MHLSWYTAGKRVGDLAHFDLCNNHGPKGKQRTFLHNYDVRRLENNHLPLCHCIARR